MQPRLTTAVNFVHAVVCLGLPLLRAQTRTYIEQDSRASVKLLMRVQTAENTCFPLEKCQASRLKFEGDIQINLHESLPLAFRPNLAVNCHIFVTILSVALCGQGMLQGEAAAMGHLSILACVARLMDVGSGSLVPATLMRRLNKIL